jgi:aspartate aminotransferase-like enzyme
MKDNTWRIGLMGAGATKAHAELCLSGLRSVLG